jgi:hypothetical protein
MTFNINPYYSPELCGLEIFESINTADSYEYDMFVIWRKLDDNTLYYDTDSGCSCPTPFDIADHGNDLKLINDELFHGFDEALKNHDKISKADYIRIKNKVKDYLRNKL